MTNRLTKKDKNGKYYTVATELGLGGKSINPITNWIEDCEERNFGNPIDKLGRLEDLEEQIGCPLDVVFKALKNGFKFKISSHKLGTKQETVEQIIYCDYAYIYYANDIKEWCISTINDYFYLKDYQKTWWLKEDKVE